MKTPVEFFTLLVVAISIFYPVFSAILVDYSGDHRFRRILHHPLFPEDTPAPPAQTPLSPTPTTAAQNPLFFPHTLPGPPPNQTQTVSPAANASDQNRTDTSDQGKIKPAGKVFIAVSVSIVALGILIALTCFFYYRRRRNSAESEKLVGQGAAVRHVSGEANRIRRPAMSAPSRFLYIGTVEPSKSRSGEIKNSPYHRLNESHVRLGLHQPSPELQPLPPLSGPLPPLSGPPQWSPSATMSPDEEDSYYSAKASLTGSNWSPGRLALQQRFPTSTTTNTTTTTNRSSTSTNSSINTNTSSDGAMVQRRHERFSAERRPTESRDTAPRISIASSPTLQPMTVSDLLPSPQHDMPSPPMVRSNYSPLLSSTASSPLPLPIYAFPSALSEKSDRPTSPPPAPLVPPSQTQLPPPISRQQQPPPSPTPTPRPSQRPPPPSPPPRPTQRPPPLPPRPLVQPHHLMLNNDRLPEPCRPTMAAHLQNQALSSEPRSPKNQNSGSTGQAPAANVNKGAFPEQLNDTEGDNSRPRLKPLHWDKVRASSDRAMVWDRLKSSSFTLDEDMIETLFICKPSNSSQKESLKKVVPPAERDTRVLDPKKSQNIAILLRALNVTRDEVCEALLEGNPEGLGVELLETLLRMTPTKEEELRLKEYCGDLSKLGPAERFLKAVLDIPFAFKRIDALLYVANFESEVKYLRKSFETLEAACEELRSSRLFLRLLQAVLKTGNRMNTGTSRGGAEAFKLDTLLKLIDIKGTDGKTTLLHFVVQEIIRSEGQTVYSNEEHQQSELKGENTPSKVRSCMTEDNLKKTGLRVVSGLRNELSHAKKAAGMDSDVLSSYLSKLAAGLEKIKSIMQLEDSQRNSESYNRKFCESMKQFVDKAEMEILRVKAEESVALSLVKEITEYFHGDAAKEEAHPFRIFMIVRDFLSLLDKVCKEVGTMQEREIMGSARNFLIPEKASLPVFPRFQRSGSSDKESSSP